MSDCNQNRKDTSGGTRQASPANGRAAIYARYSTRFQDSIEDQVRECREWAEANGYEVPDEFVFVDKSCRGGSARRSGLKALQETIGCGKVQAVVIFATSRLFRKTYRALEFVDQQLVERGIRCVFVKSGIDTADKDDWEFRLHVQSLIDEHQVRSTKAHIRAAHIGHLLKGRVFGTVTYGYRGEEITGEKTKTGKPACRIVIDPRTSAWVRKIFAWYVEERLSISAIVRKLNEEDAPLPPRCGTGRWTYLAVRNLLRNPRYTGRWQYGRTEARWLGSKDYVRQFEREVPLKTEHYEDLRIISEETWHKAQELMVGNPHNAGRRAIDGRRGSRRPKLLNGLLYCGYHDRPLVVGGGNGGAYLCPVCHEDGEKQLFSMLNRRLALRVICQTVAKLIRGDDALVGQIIDACRAAAEAPERPDRGQLDQLRQRCEKLSRHISQVMGMPAETEEDLRETAASVAQLRRERAAANAEIARLEAAANRTVRVPEKPEVRERLDSLADVIARAGEGDDEQEFGKASRIIEQVTGGRIAVFQAGPRERKRGWLRGEFRAAVVRFVAAEHGAAVADCATGVRCDFRDQPVHERIADEVKRLFDEGWKYTEIAEKVGWNRSIVAKALAFWHRSHGLSAQDGRKCVGRLRRSAPLAERIADPVMERTDRDVPLKDIAKELGVGRNAVTRAIRIGHERRGLPVPDGRALRKARNARRRSGLCSQPAGRGAWADQ